MGVLGKHSLILGLALVCASFAQASEIDPFTLDREKISDSSVQLNAYINSRLQSAIRARNSSGNACSAKALRRSLALKISMPLKSQMESYVLENADVISQKRFKLEDSVYRDFTFLKLIDYLPIGKIGSVLNVGGTYIGSDKFGHMHTEGYFYYLDIYGDGDGIEDVLMHGINMEAMLFGTTTTGVFSFGDMSANLNGIRFWNDIFYESPDLLGAEYGAGPYVACDNNKLRQVKQIDISHYVDLSLDETVNCNVFSSDKLFNRFGERVEAVGKSRGIANLKCSMSAEQREALTQKYGKYSEYILNPKGESYSGNLGLMLDIEEDAKVLRKKFESYYQQQKDRLLQRSE